jgi:hypothetical protein
MAREHLARDFDPDHRSSPRSAGATAGTVVRLDATVTTAASTGSALHRTVSVPAGAPTPARTSADVRSSTHVAPDFTNEYDFDGSAAAGGQYGV